MNISVFNSLCLSVCACVHPGALWEGWRINILSREAGRGGISLQGLFLFLKYPPHAFNNSAGSFFFSLLPLDTMPTFPTSGLNMCSPSLSQKTQTEELHIKDTHKAELFVSCAVRLYRAWVTLRPHCLCLERWAFTGNVSLLFFIQNVS